MSRPFTSPELIFDRRPNALDRARRLGTTAVVLGSILRHRDEDANSSGIAAKQWERVHASEAQFVSDAGVFETGWRPLLSGPDRPRKVLLTQGRAHEIRADVNQEDRTTNVTAAIRSAAGHITRIGIEIERLSLPEETDLVPGTVPVELYARIAMQHSRTGMRDTRGYGFYNPIEEATLFEVGSQILSELSVANLETGQLEVL